MKTDDRPKYETMGLKEYYKYLKSSRIKSKINFTLVGEVEERVLNGTREAWESHKVSKYIVKRAQALLEKDQLETFILDADLDESTITFCYAMDWDVPFHPEDDQDIIWNECLRSAWYMMLEVLDIDSSRVRYI